MKQISVGTFRTTPLIWKYVISVLKSERISYGAVSRRFEADFARLHGQKFAVLSNSGTSSLQAAIHALKVLRGWQDGDEIILPAVTFVASVNVVLQNRLQPVLVDIDPRYYEIDPKLIEKAITPRTRAIMPVHVFGQPCDMKAISAIAQAHQLAVIEDSCECMFAKHHDKYVWGDVACYSTYVAHLISTGVGGLALTDDPALAIKMRSLVNHGRDGIYLSIDDDDAITPEIISRRFRFESIGYSYRITELEAALGLAQLETWNDMIAQRRANAEFLTHRLEPYRWAMQLPAVRPDTQHSWMMYPLVFWKNRKRKLCEHLEANGIETREMLPLTNQPCYSFREDDYLVAQWVNRSGFYIGIHQDLNTDDLDYIAKCVGEYFERPYMARYCRDAAQLLR